MRPDVRTDKCQSYLPCVLATKQLCVIKGALEGAEPVTCRYKSITTAVLSIVPFEQSTR